MAMRPLSGLRVLEISDGPLAAIGRQIAELGAHVTQIVKTGDEPGLIQAVERLGKSVENATLNEAFSASLQDRLAATDILIVDTEYAPTIDTKAIAAQFPDLIVLALSPFGLEGRCKDWQLTEPVIHALSGELSRSGIPDREPLLPPDGVAWGCAASQAVYAVLLSFWNRVRNSQGNFIDFSVFEGASLTLDPGYGIAGSAAAGVPAHKQPWGRPEGRQRYPILPCKDGYVRICVLAKRQWRAMFEFMGKPEAFADPQFDLLHVRFKDPDLIPAISAFFSTMTGDELEAEGEKRGIPIARVYKFEDAIRSPQISARDMFVPREILPGRTALTPNGALEINGERMNADEASSASGDNWTGSPLPPSARPFEGLKVLDLGVIVVGAETGRLFADQGADVIKVENSTFADGMRQNKGTDLISQTFAAGNRNKRGLGINLRSEQGIALFKKLVAESDLVLANFKAGTLDSLGLGYDTLKAIKPDVILVDSSAFGPTGPWSKRLGYGPLVRASIGMCDLWRHEGDAEGFGDALTVHPDHLASRIGTIGALALLIDRLRTGKGGRVSVSQAETALNNLGGLAAQADLERQGIEADLGDGKDTPWGVFPTGGEDDWCVITVRNSEDWQTLCGVMGRGDLADDTSLATPEGRRGNRQTIESAVKDWLSGFTDAREPAEILQTKGVPAAPMLRIQQIPEFPAFVDRKLFVAVSHPHISEDMIQEDAPTRMTTIQTPDTRPAPVLGEHTRDIIRDWLGLPDDQISEFIAAGDLEEANV